MKIAITGASGFIGKKVIEELAGKTEIIALTRSISIEQTTEDVRWVQTDYSVELLSEQFHGVDVVIHLAAVRGVSGNIADYHSNECLTENILIAMGNSGVRHIVFASSI